MEGAFRNQTPNRAENDIASERAPYIELKKGTFVSLPCVAEKPLLQGDSSARKPVTSSRNDDIMLPLSLQGYNGNFYRRRLWVPTNVRATYPK